MEILLLPMLVFVFVVVVIVLYNRMSNVRKKVDKSWKAFQHQLTKQQELQDVNNHSINDELENLRLDYNKKATAYNRIIQKFPTSFMASMSGYKARKLYGEDN